ncbi:Sterol desaturase/sphingolipid hydroxylase, fatty acid hydroxylase superfamily [Atopomonas hussainii]|uniref:Sterol desaturase/sphingolipid hydroxylase, fatty acid hydroxylase superfamily n=1 Tax=Atopomonas hussainii TaxID=1429083 RepID=A0A1H7N4J4_9GAMM|nr:sterol desaturase family protein [Atopomonas hussainii]SEL18229.1 Sterol desaturase/sphingolipid hydroxylase, fatty acid hydroxylase superfamily [Atopomonas hussainii]
MNLILFAVPFFLLLIALELIADWRSGKRTYRLSDTINSLSAGVLSRAVGILTKFATVGIYLLSLDYLAVWQLSADSLWVWLLAFVAYDFCYYWNHRLGHEMNVLWAAHSVHHQSEDYNLGTALRQTSTGWLFSWLFYLPMAVLGIPGEVFITVAALNLLYQFWVHTQHIGKLGWYEWFFVTPSNHRVHHAQNPLYIDRNYGGVFIIWDRLFGTFHEEQDSEPVIFGVTKPLASWNPLWANAQFYVQLWHDAVRAERWQDKLTIWFRRTGWRPADVAARYPMATPDLSQFRKFDIALSRSQQVYAACQFAVTVLGTVGLMAAGEQLGLGAALLLSAWVAFTLYATGVWLEDRPHARLFEGLRLLASTATVLWLLASGLLSGAAFWLGLSAAYVALSVWGMGHSKRLPDQAASA